MVTGGKTQVNETILSQSAQTYFNKLRLSPGGFRPIYAGTVPQLVVMLTAGGTRWRACQTHTKSGNSLLCRSLKVHQQANLGATVPSQASI